ncbi:MAG: hypothetical protein KVP17_003921 [Porospora cf. gigantea B]|uniref:uncharacterized protein n=1 Tax=Porospora cf. gigantea B TaxID=2853592 RepID=UPI003571EA1F|nr:MAG: hypothetical protein KVP17_003921 [Porospora cf. gigantea B]
MTSSDVDAFVAKHCPNALAQRAIEKTASTDRFQSKLQLHKPPKDLTSDLPRSVEYVPLFKPRSQQLTVTESTNIGPVMESDLFPACAPPKFPPTTPGDEVSLPPSAEDPQPCTTGLRFSEKSEALFVFGQVTKGDGVKAAVSSSKPRFPVQREKVDPSPTVEEVPWWLKNKDKPCLVPVEDAVFAENGCDTDSNDEEAVTPSIEPETVVEEVPWWLKNKDKPCLVPVEDAVFAENGCDTDSNDDASNAPSIEPETVVEEVPWWLKNKDKPCLVPVEDAEFADIASSFEDDNSDTTLAGNIFGQTSGNQLTDTSVLTLGPFGASNGSFRFFMFYVIWQLVWNRRSLVWRLWNSCWSLL